MRFLKALNKWFFSVAFLAIIFSFSGFSNSTVNFQKTQTELIDNAKYFNSSSDFHYSQLSDSSEKQTYNQYTVFNFKCFLIKHHFDFNITFKTQKGKIVQLENYNSILEQNLIAIHYSNSYNLL